MLHNFTISPYLIQTTPANFLADKEQQGFGDLIFAPSPDGSDRYPIRVLIIGIPDGVNSIIHELYVKHFAQVYEWSPAIKANQSGEIMKVMTRYYVMHC